MSDCTEVKFYSPSDKFGGVKKQNSCDIQVNIKIPETLREPKDEFKPVIDYVPNGIRLYNVEKQASCADGMVGDVGKTFFVTPACQFVSVVYFNSVTSIKQTTLEYIAKNELDKLIQGLTEQRPTQFNTPYDKEQWLDELSKTIASTTGISYQESTQLVSLFNEQWTILDNQAVMLAQTSIECFYENDEVTVVCDETSGKVIDTTYTDSQGQIHIKTKEQIKQEAEEWIAEKQYAGDKTIYVIAAGLFRSPVSKQNANDQAILAGKSGLDCYFVNDERVVTCTDRDRPDKPWDDADIPEEGTPEYEEWLIQHLVPSPTQFEWEAWLNDVGAATYGLSRPVGTFVVEAGTIKSYNNKEDANVLADNLAWAGLNCYYINDTQDISCASSDARGYGVNPSESSTQDAILPSISGQHVVVGTGYTTSELSPSDANDKAIALANTLLECCYTNDTITVKCKPYNVLDGQGNIIDIINPADTTIVAGAVDTYTVPSGTFFSCEGTPEEAKQFCNEQARLLAESSLVCYYCNNMVLPTCVPTWVTQALTTGLFIDHDVYKEGEEELWIPANTFWTPDPTTFLPLNPEDLFNPYTGEKEDVSTWSVNATAGIPPNIVCTQDANPLAPIIDDITEPVLRQGDECPFTNDLLIAGCQLEDPYNGAGKTPSGETYKFYSMWPSVDASTQETICISNVLSSPIPGEYIEIPAKTFVFTSLDVPGTKLQGEDGYDYDENARLVKEYANNAAINLAKTMLYCVFANPVTSVTCTGSTDVDLCADKWNIGMNYDSMYPGRALYPGSNDYSNPVIIPYGTFISQTSMQDVYDKTNIFAQSVTTCLYGNNKMSCSCKELRKIGDQINTGTVAENSIIAADPYTADSKAKGLACAMTVCLDLSAIQGQPGPPGAPGAPGRDGNDGPQGPQGSCSGTCYGVYS